MVLTYVYNNRRQVTYQDATTIPAGVDDAVKSIGYTYDNLARVEKVTSYDDVSTGSPSIVNEVAYVFNDLGQVTDSYQDHSGAATSADPTVTYSYDLSATSSVYDDGARLSYVLYPGNVETTSTRRKVGYGYLPNTADAIYDRLDRPISVWTNHDDATNGIEYEQKAVMYSSPRGKRGRRVFNHMDDFGGSNTLTRPWYATSDDGYDRFGRRVSIIEDDLGSATHDAELNYGYDAASNRVYREDVLAAAQTTPQDLDELYGHDDLNRLDNFQLGGLNGNKDAIAAADRDYTQQWTLDQLGNWEGFDKDANGDEDFTDAVDLDQARTSNDVNEITDITEAAGQTAWVTPAYDASGNMTTVPWRILASGLTGTYDAWNRLVKLDNAPFTQDEYEYDGLGRRIVKHVYTFGLFSFEYSDHYYYNESWQVLEVRRDADWTKGGDPDANPREQFVYDTNYIDAMLIRWYDEDTDGVYAGETGSDSSDDKDGEQYYLYDASFNVIALLDDQGDALERYRYTPYGERTVMDANFANPSGGSSYDQQRGFQGLLHDAESGLIENRARMYDPLTGRFLQRDPHRSIYPDGYNSYAAYHVMYGGVDPSGMEKARTFKWDWSDKNEYSDQRLRKMANSFRDRAIAAGKAGDQSEYQHLAHKRTSMLNELQRRKKERQTANGGGLTNRYRQAYEGTGCAPMKEVNRQANMSRESMVTASTTGKFAEKMVENTAKEGGIEIATAGSGKFVSALRHTDEVFDLATSGIRATDGFANNGRKLVDDISLPRNKQRQMLREALGGVPGDGKVAHHVVPLESLDEHADLMQKAAQGGFDINGCNNGLLMDVGEDMMQHMGPHNSYNKALLDALGDLDADALTPGEAAQAVQGIADTAREAIESGTFPPNNSW